MDEILDYYIGLLIIQYNSLPKAQETIGLFVDPVLGGGLPFDVRDAFDIDTATGVQLDTLGKYIGVNRFFQGQTFSGDFFGFADAGNVGGVSSNIVGFNDAVSPDKSGMFLDASTVIASNLRLNDDAYRTLLKLKVVQNSNNHSFKSISDGIYTFFGDSIFVKDNYDMTMTYLIGDASSALVEAALQKGVLPKPMGVGLEVINGNKFLGFADAAKLDFVSPNVVGFNDATLGLIKEGGFLNASMDIINT